MTIGSTNISMNAISQEKQATQLPQATQNISLKGLSVDGVNDFEFAAGGSATDIAVAGSSPDQAAPHGLGEFSGYEQFAWGTPGSITTNTGFPFNSAQERRNGSDTCIVTSCNMVLNTSTKVITFTFTNTSDGGGFSSNFGSTNTASLSYTGTLSTLQAKFVSSGDALTVGTTSGDFGTVRELWSTSSHLSNADINNNNITGSNVTSNTNLTSSGNFGTYNSLRTSSGNMAIALACCTDNVSTGQSVAKVQWSGSDSMGVTLRANGTTEVSIYSRTGAFSIDVQSTEEDTS